MANEHLLTPAAYEKLKKDLEELKGPVRSRIAEAIREAKSHGDLKENAAYHEAKLNQTRLEQRIADLEKRMQLAKVVEQEEDDGMTARLGRRVTLFEFEFEEEFVIHLVSSYEADPSNDLISITSPLGSALLGKTPGDHVEVEAPAGVHRYKIQAIE